MKMVRITLLILALAIPGMSWARKPAAAKSAPCARCSDIRALEAKFLALKYENDKDQAAGRLLMVRLLAQLERFHTFKKAPGAAEEFRALVSLVATALPYDQGTESGESIASLITDSRNLKTIYNQVAAGLTDSCRQQLLRKVIDERVCMIEVEERGQADQRPLACVKTPVFRYDHCVGLNLQD